MARMVLPQNMMTQWIETGSLYYWFNLCRLRLDSHAQKEIGDLAAQVSAAMSASFPVSWQALLDASKEVTA
jgi:thymidylate synthase (FAD)